MYVSFLEAKDNYKGTKSTKKTTCIRILTFDKNPKKTEINKNSLKQNRCNLCTLSLSTFTTYHKTREFNINFVCHRKSTKTSIADCTFPSENAQHETLC